MKKLFNMKSVKIKLLNSQNEAREQFSMGSMANDNTWLTTYKNSPASRRAMPSPNIMAKYHNITKYSPEGILQTKTLLPPTSMHRSTSF